MKKRSGYIITFFFVALVLFISSHTGKEPKLIAAILLVPGVVYLLYLIYRIYNPKYKVSNNQGLKEALDDHRKLLKKSGFADELVEHDKMAKDLLYSLH